MTLTSIATILSGGEGVGIGARAAGLHHLWGIEIDDKIAQVARDNGFHMIIADIRHVDPQTLEMPDVLHASPECQNASSAKQVQSAKTFEEKETPLDVDIARCIVRYVEILRPRIFTLENVYGYRRFEAFRIILRALNRLGYFTDFGNLNAADFGVAQTRRRLILRAVRGGLVPMLPPPESWVGWYEAIRDLIPTLPESEFAPWQRMGYIQQSAFQESTQGATETSMRTIINESVLVDSAGYPNTDGEIVPVTRCASRPANTIVANHARRPMRAFIVGGQFGKPDDGSGEPRPPQTRNKLEPVFTVTARNKGDWRAWLSWGRVVKMTPRALARFQSFPDSYILPDSNRLACKIIGNAVPPLMYQKIVVELLR